MSTSKNRFSGEIDVLGRQHELRDVPSRVVSLVPSLTETLFALDLGDTIKGVTDYCIFPEIPADVIRVGGTKNPKVDRIRDLEPDLVYVNVEENLKRHAVVIEEFVPVFATEPRTVRGVRELLEQLGRIHDRRKEAAKWIEMLDAVVDRIASSPASFTFVSPIWKDPWMWCGGDTYVSDLITVAGGTNLLAEKERYPRIELEQVLESQPDVIFLPDEPYEFQPEDGERLRGAGVRSVVGPFPGHLFTWHGIRTIAGLEFLADFVSRPDRGEEVARGDSGRLQGFE